MGSSLIWSLNLRLPFTFTIEAATLTLLPPILWLPPPPKIIKSSNMLIDFPSISVPHHDLLLATALNAYRLRYPSFSSGFVAHRAFFFFFLITVWNEQVKRDWGLWEKLCWLSSVIHCDWQLLPCNPDLWHQQGCGQSSRICLPFIPSGIILWRWLPCLTR